MSSWNHHQHSESEHGAYVGSASTNSSVLQQHHNSSAYETSQRSANGYLGGHGGSSSASYPSTLAHMSSYGSSNGNGPSDYNAAPLSSSTQQHQQRLGDVYGQGHGAYSYSSEDAAYGGRHSGHSNGVASSEHSNDSVNESMQMQGYESQHPHHVHQQHQQHSPEPPHAAPEQDHHYYHQSQQSPHRATHESQPKKKKQQQQQEQHQLPNAAEDGEENGDKTKRKQVKNACVNCQKACKKCDEGRPCSRCVKLGLELTCENSTRKERQRGIKRGPYKRRAKTLQKQKQAFVLAASYAPNASQYAPTSPTASYSAVSEHGLASPTGEVSSPVQRKAPVLPPTSSSYHYSLASVASSSAYARGKAYEGSYYNTRPILTVNSQMYPSQATSSGATSASAYGSSSVSAYSRQQLAAPSHYAHAGTSPEASYAQPHARTQSDNGGVLSSSSPSLAANVNAVSANSASSAGSSASSTMFSPRTPVSATMPVANPTITSSYQQHGGFVGSQQTLLQQQQQQMAMLAHPQQGYDASGRPKPFPLSLPPRAKAKIDASSLQADGGDAQSRPAFMNLPSVTASMRAAYTQSHEGAAMS